MNKKIAIHHRKYSFSEQWIQYCEKNNIPYKIVNCYNNNIIEQIKDCDALMWHLHHNHPKDILFAKQLMFALEQTGMKTFPDFNTMWHFDDKVGQKYLFEAIDAPLVKTYVFYDEKLALKWANDTEFPKVFKLRSGSGASNVSLVSSRNEAEKVIKRAFRKGFKQRNPFTDLKERTRKFKLGKADIIQLFGGVVRVFNPHDYEKIKGIEIGYIYFQDFIPNNKFDIRVVVIEDKAFAIKRMVRGNDFRASGSGEILYDKSNFDERDILLALKLAKSLNIQCFAVDIVSDNGKSKIIELSYGFSQQGYEPCVGYWDQDLNFHEGLFNPYGWMVESVLNTIEL